MGTPFLPKWPLKMGTGFGGFSGTPPSEPILSYPPPRGRTQDFSRGVFNISSRPWCRASPETPPHTPMLAHIAMVLTPYVYAMIAVILGANVHPSKPVKIAKYGYCPGGGGGWGGGGGVTQEYCWYPCMSKKNFEKGSLFWPKASMTSLRKRVVFQSNLQRFWEKKV